MQSEDLLSALSPCTRKGILTFQNTRTGSFPKAATLRKKKRMTLGSLTIFLFPDREVSADRTVEMALCPGWQIEPGSPRIFPFHWVFFVQDLKGATFQWDSYVQGVTFLSLFLFAYTWMNTLKKVFLSRNISTVVLIWRHTVMRTIMMHAYVSRQSSTVAPESIVIVIRGQYCRRAYDGDSSFLSREKWSVLLSGSSYRY